MPTYSHLFFDLDHTLWDFERNSAESLNELYETFDLQQYITSPDAFAETFSRVNLKLWDDFDHGRIPHAHIREHRFRMVLEALEVPPLSFMDDMGEEYLRLLPQKTHLLDGALDLLHYLAQKDYELHIISNGFDYIQARKMQSSGIEVFFKEVITNEKAGAKKPDPKIFDYALQSAGAVPKSSLMIGDNWIADIQGAMRFGIDSAFYNPQALIFDETPTYDIRHLEELKNIL
ncbi:MAG: YjjG family noncanonical pyrimidine nucleotidase [Spirosomaceae bacterium]|nr:YjjG family noncanonical pyrimidine nucleotidase [Spirosomataceae bacterium]